MEQDDYYEDRDDFPEYRERDKIAPSELTAALGSLHLLDDDPYLRMQVFNLSIVDQFIMELEADVLRRLQEDEHTPAAEGDISFSAISNVDIRDLRAFKNVARESQGRNKAARKWRPEVKDRSAKQGAWLSACGPRNSRGPASKGPG